ncbi:MAG: class I SAM-dependent methyltransferase [Gammaproteobacteria bacterium]|nr:class I SAM-dependent methyltransferase [Gammaproteobacteria bacterium]
MKATFITNIFVKITDASVRLRQFLWRWVYNLIAKRDKQGHFLFMNYGYYDQAETPLALNPEDEMYRAYINLYNHVIQDVDLQSKCLVEVGCGRGGGGSFIVRYKNPLSYTGVDLSDQAISWCQKTFNSPAMSWKQGSAESLPIPDDSVDVVINVESSHCYPSMPNFLSEVKRILKSQGYFAYCDMRRLPGLPEVEHAIQNCGLQIFKQEDITSQVLNSLDHTSAQRDAEVTAVFHPLFQSTFRAFAGVKDTTVYNMLKNGEMKYFSYLLRKNG